MIKKDQNINIFYFPKNCETVIRKAVKETLISEKVKKTGEINLILIKDLQIKKLNSKFRKVNRITDVISFCYKSEPVEGDIFIAVERSKSQARQQPHSWDKELVYLTIHGVLHLLGYTDYTIKSKKMMFAVQDKIMQCLFS